MQHYQVIILAGGMGTRLSPVTKTIPKVLVPISDRPFVFWQLDLLIDNGINEIVMCVGYKGEEVERVVGSLYRGAPIKYSYERQDELLGTGGALKNAEHLLNTSFGVIYGDSYLEIDYVSVFEAHKSSSFPVTMTVWKNQNCLENSNVLLSEDGMSVTRYEKTGNSNGFQYIDYGFSVFDKEIISSYSGAGVHMELSTLQYDLSKENRLGAFEVNQRFYEIGSKSGLKEFETYLLDHNINKE